MNITTNESQSWIRIEDVQLGVPFQFFNPINKEVVKNVYMRVKNDSGVLMDPSRIFLVCLNDGRLTWSVQNTQVVLAKDYKCEMTF